MQAGGQGLQHAGGRDVEAQGLLRLVEPEAALDTLLAGQQGQGRVQGAEGIVIAGHDPAHGLLAGQQDLPGQTGIQGVAGTGAFEQAATAGDEQGQGLFPGLEGRITGQAVGPGQGQTEGARDQGGQELFALGGQKDEAGGGRGLFQCLEQGIGRVAAVLFHTHEQHHAAALAVGSVAQLLLELADVVHVQGADGAGMGLVVGIADAAVVGQHVQMFTGVDLHAGGTDEAGVALAARLRAVDAGGPVTGGGQALGLGAAFQQQDLRRIAGQAVEHLADAVEVRRADILEKRHGVPRCAGA